MALREAAVRRLPDESPETADIVASDERFSVWYRRYYPRLVAMCKRRVGQEALAEDIAQETLIRALTHQSAFDVSRPPWPWLKTIATNLIVDHFRRQGREALLVTEGPGQNVENPSLEEADLLHEAIKRLPRRQRAAVALRYLNDWDADHAATFMGVTKPAYDQLLFRARRRLQTEYRRLCEEVSASALVAAGWIRTAARRTGYKLREIATTKPALSELTSVSVTQLAGGALTIALVLGGIETSPAAPAATRPPHSSSFQDARVANSVGHIGRHGSHGSRAQPSAGSGEVAPSLPREEAPSTHNENRPLISQITGEDVQQPEDAHLTSIALAPSYSQDGTAYAAGRADCPNTACPAVLFESNDGGASWTRLDAQAFEAEALLLPPGFASGDERFFAMGRLGLQVTADGGKTFSPATPAGPGQVVGSATVSPAFHEGDPTILIGAQTLMRYRDDLKVVEPAASTSGTGPLEPSFSPQYPSDPRILVGGLHHNPEAGRLTGAVYTCTGTVCSSTSVGRDSLVPQVRPAGDFAISHLAYAFTARTLYRSSDGAESFEEVTRGWQHGILRDVAVGPRGSLLAAVDGRDGGLYGSIDDGRSWTRAGSPLFDGGATRVAVAGDTVVVALGETGLACSRDGGETWTARC